MNKLSKEKRDQIILVSVATAVVMALLWFFVVAEQQSTLGAMAAKQRQLQEKISKAEAANRKGADLDKKLQECSGELAERENTLAPERDSYSWMLNLMTHFVQSRDTVRIASISQPTIKSDLDLIPKFPYKSAVFQVRATGYYHQIGKFIAEFENAYPCFQVQGLKLEPIGGLAANARNGLVVASDGETVQVELEIVTPIKPSDPASASK